ncbi:hypothetical protein J4474_02320 [Candidatus Pacearchaeota archaeon]|nr:hypothetical protein [Candidatus Pacearchaeota archaeon]
MVKKKSVHQLRIEEIVADPSLIGISEKIDAELEFFLFKKGSHYDRDYAIDVLITSNNGLYVVEYKCFGSKSNTNCAKKQLIKAEVGLRRMHRPANHFLYVHDHFVVHELMNGIWCPKYENFLDDKIIELD